MFYCQRGYMGNMNEQNRHAVIPFNIDLSKMCKAYFEKKINFIHFICL